MKNISLYLSLVCLISTFYLSAQPINSHQEFSTQNTLDSARFYLSSQQYVKARYWTDIAIEKARKSNNETQLTEGYLKLIRIENIAPIDKQTNCKQIIDNATQELKDSFNLAKIYLTRSQAFLNSPEFDSIKYYLDLSKPYLVQDSVHLYKIYYEIYYGYYYYKNLEYLKALDRYSLAKRMAESISNEDVIHEINPYLAFLYRDFGAYDYAHEILDEGISTFKNNNDIRLLQFNYLNKINFLTENKDFAEAILYSDSLIDIHKNVQPFQFIFGAYQEKGHAYIFLNQLDSAKYYLDLGLELATKDNNDYAIGLIYGSLALLEIRNNNNELAKKYGEEYIKYFPNGDLDFNTEMSSLYSEEKNYKKAFQFSNLNNVNLDLLENNYKIISTLLNEKFENEEKIKSLAFNQEIEQQQQRVYLLSGIVLFSLISMVGFFWAYRQIRQRNELLQKDVENKKLIEEQAHELRKNEALKSRFFSNISHELRTPLTLIINPVKQLLINDSFDAKTKESLNGILDNSNELLSMTNQILDLTKKEITDINVVPSKFSLQRFFQHIFKKYLPLAESKHIDLQLTNKPGSDVILINDASKLNTIVGNLVSNAIKYSNDNSEVNISVNQKGENIVVYVKDKGRGIHEKDITHIFDHYYQSKYQHLRPQGGYGIGLSICKEYIQALGGTISVNSKINEGSEFILTFPKIINHNPSNISTVDFKTETNNRTVLNKTNKKEHPFVLVVEDDLKMCKYLKELLKEEYHLVFAHNGKDALHLIQKTPPLLIITDIMMPVMDGLELIEEIKNQDKWKGIPVLALTANNNIIIEMKALRTGVDSYLMKPFEEFELKTSLYNLLNNAEEREESQSYLINSEIQTSIDNQELKLLEEKIAPLITDVNLNIDSLAKELNMSPTKLNILMKKETGLTPKRYINELRLLKARKMLDDKVYDSVKAVAYSVGFNSSKLFSRKFKARFGKYPSEFLSNSSSIKTFQKKINVSDISGI